VVRIDGMVKLMLEQHRISYLPIESVSMQERVRAVEFVLTRCGLGAMTTATPTATPTPTTTPTTAVPAPRPRTRTIPPMSSATDVLKASIDAWPYALVETSDHEA
jgi:hypothetical protein